MMSQQQQNQQETASLAAAPVQAVDPNVEKFMEMVKTLEKDLDLSPTTSTQTIVIEELANNDQTASQGDLQKIKEPYKNDNLNLKKRKRQRSTICRSNKKTKKNKDSKIQNNNNNSNNNNRQ